jgi:hypothetical protein
MCAYIKLYVPKLPHWSDTIPLCYTLNQCFRFNVKNATQNTPSCKCPFCNSITVCPPSLWPMGVGVGVVEKIELTFKTQEPNLWQVNNCWQLLGHLSAQFEVWSKELQHLDKLFSFVLKSQNNRLQDVWSLGWRNYAQTVEAIFMKKTESFPCSLLFYQQYWDRPCLGIILIRKTWCFPSGEQRPDHQTRILKFKSVPVVFTPKWRARVFGHTYAWQWRA